MPKQVRISLNDASSVSSAIKELREYRRWISEKTKELNEELAKLGAKVAETGFAGKGDEGDDPATVSVQKKGKGWVITAHGKTAFFVEFGAGIYYNGAEPYPEDRPAGVVKIGEYGKGRGKTNGWYFIGKDGNKVFTRGTKAEMPMYHAKKTIEQELTDVAVRVFSGE